MSLINEALKRTRDASYQPASAPPDAAPNYRIQNEVKSRGFKGTLFVTVLVTVVALSGIVVLGLWIAPSLKKLKDGFAPDASSTVAEAAQPVPTVRPTPVRPIETPAPAQSTPTPASVQTPPIPAIDPKITEDELVARLMEKMKAEQALKPQPAEPPKLVLQGMTYAGDSSEAMINGVSLRAGEDIEGARIVTIERRAVRLDFGGREIVLRIP